VISIGAEVFILEITDGRTLKDKRQVVRSLLDRARSRYRVAAAEVEDLDSPGRATIAVVAVANEQPRVDSVLQRVAEMVEAEARVFVISRNTEYF
jgi:uncharacterized protein